MKFIPNSSIKDQMLKEIGLKDIDELFSDIPQKIKIEKLDLEDGLSQCEAEKKLRNIADKNKSVNDVLFFSGGGVKPHYIPAVVKSIVSRSEFFTAYTPYQPEASQGFLQAMFEYQSMIAEITGMDVANASMYDGATSLGEAALMCKRIKRRKKIFLIPESISWEKKSVLKNYVRGTDLIIKEISFDDKTGKIDLEELKESLDDNTAGVYVENPNFFGVFEDKIDEISKLVKNNDSLFVVGIDPLSLGIVESPGSYDADIVIGEGKALGNPIDFGGSTLGVFASKKNFLRKMPGRIIGMTEDIDGERAFCMALQTREQHIRRGRATSNICTNEGLCALAAVSYLSWLGGNGLKEIGEANFNKGEKLANSIASVDGFEKRFDSCYFNEFVIKSKFDPKLLNKKLLKEDVQGGLLLDRWYPNLENCMLFGVSEVYEEKEIDLFISILKEVKDEV